MRGEHCQSVCLRARCVSRIAKRVGLRGQRPRIKSGKQPLRGKAESQEGWRTSWRCHDKGGKNRNGGWREKTEKRDGAGGVCARASVATVHAR
eukprot:6207512-Pleurochrysis_carterae.AAC.2